MPSITNDNPISDESEDYLGRGAFAQSITDLINSFDADSSFRIGIYGGWGEGKTSILKMVERQLLKSGHITLWLPSWGALSSDALLETLLFDVGEKLKISTGTARIKKYARLGFGAARSAVKVAGPIGNSIDDAFGDDVERMVQQKSAEAIRRDLLPSIVKALAGRKLIVFVDDLDRVRPEVIPDFLLSLRELLNLPNFHFLLALSPDIVHEGLAQLHRGWGRVESFLEKIIELPMFLPIVQTDDFECFAQSQIAALGDRLDLNAIKGISELLPKNPRKLKLLLRNLAGLHHVLGRFNTDEIDLKALYICQTLRFEFPQQSMKLLADSAALNAMDQARYGFNFDRDTTKSAPLPEEKYRPEMDGERYSALCTYLRSERGLVRGSYTLENMLSIRENPPLVTYGEVSQLLTDFSIASSEVRGPLVDEFLGTDNLRDSRMRALFVRMVEARNSFLDLAAGALSVDSIRERVQEAEVVAELLYLLIARFRLFESSVGGKEEWMALYNHIMKWNRWIAYDFYQNARVVELNLLAASAELLPSKTQLDVWSDLQRADEWSDSAPLGDLKSLVDRVRTMFTQTTFDTILSSFLEIDGVGSLFRTLQHNAAAQALIDPSSGLFTRKEQIDRLHELAKSAPTNSTVHANFFDLVYLPAWGAYSPDSRLPRTDLTQLFENAELTSMLWSAAMARPVNMRNMNSLWEYRARIIADGVPEMSMPKPPWFEPPIVQ